MYISTEEECVIWSKMVRQAHQDTNVKHHKHHLFGFVHENNDAFWKGRTISSDDRPSMTQYFEDIASLVYRHLAEAYTEHCETIWKEESVAGFESYLFDQNYEGISCLRRQLVQDCLLNVKNVQVFTAALPLFLSLKKKRFNLNAVYVFVYMWDASFDEQYTCRVFNLKDIMTHYLSGSTVSLIN